MSFVTPFRFVLAVLAVGLVCANVAQAQQQQQQGRRPGGFGGGGGFQSNPSQDKLQLLVNEAVQKELELADDQKSDLKKVAEDAQSKGRELFTGLQGFRDLSESEREKKMAEINAKRDAIGKDVLKKVEAVLLPHQAERLQEIYVQVRGFSLLTDDAEIAKQLSITDEQKEKLREIRTAAFAALGGGQGGQRPQGGQGNARPQGGAQGGGFDPERLAAMRKDRDEKSMAVLTGTQKEQYAKMKGEPFAEAANIRIGGFGGGGGPGGGQGGRPGQGGQGGNQQRTRPGGNNNNN